MTRRVHPLTPLLRGGLFTFAIVVIIGRNVVEGQQLPQQVLVLGAAVVAGLAYGTVSWWYTRYRITADELQIDTGVFFKKSRRIRIERLQAVEIEQPLLARLFSMAELSFDSGGTKDAEATLAFLPLKQAEQLRAVLLEQAHEARAPDAAETDPLPPGPAAPEEILYRVSPSLLLGSILTQSAFLGALATVVIGVPALLLAGQPVGLVLGVPFVLGIGNALFKGFAPMYGFTLVRTSQGLRVRSGLTSIRTTTIPVGRIQGVVLMEPWLWRRIGWMRVNLTVAGVGRGDDDKQLTSTLVPVASPQLAIHLVALLLDGADPRTIEPVTASPRAAWVDPFTWRTLGVAVNDRLVVTRRGFLTRRTDVVPRRKPQSVRCVQGPLQRRLGLATVHVDLPSGPVRLEARHRQAVEARGLVMVLADQP